MLYGFSYNGPFNLEEQWEPYRAGTLSAEQQQLRRYRLQASRSQHRWDWQPAFSSTAYGTRWRKTLKERWLQSGRPVTLRWNLPRCRRNQQPNCAKRSIRRV